MTRTVAHEILAPALLPRQERVRGLLRRLAGSPPQVLLMEGGEAEERVAMSLFWALLLDCPEPGGACLSCQTCVRIATQAHRDLFFFDGRAESIKIEPIRELRPVLGQPPRELRKRVVVLAEAQELTIPAANSLLKSLEEPCESTVFVLTVPQRERLLPTLVSRSWALTMAWPLGEPEAEGPLAEWESILAGFLHSGRGWFSRTIKGGIDRDLVRGMIRQLRGRLRQAMGGEIDAGPLAGVLESMGPEGRRALDLYLAEAQYALDAQVSPVLVYDWLASRVFRAAHS